MKDLYITLELMKQIDPKRAKILENKLKDNPFFFNSLDYTPVDLETLKPDNMPIVQNKLKKQGNNSLLIFER